MASNLRPYIHNTGFLVLCGLTIAIFVFLNSTQPFVLSDVFKRVHDAGSIIGILVLADEVTSLVAAPLWGTLSDKIGTRHISILGLVIAAVALGVYPRVPNVFPFLVLARILFAIGGSACVSMMTAMLAELSKAHSDLPRAASGSLEDPSSETPLLAGGASQTLRSGKLAGGAGMASGLGAIFAVSYLLPLPTKLGYEDHPKLAVKEAYLYVSIFVMVAAAVLFFLLYQSPSKSLSKWLTNSPNTVFDEAALDENETPSYFELLRAGFNTALEDQRLQCAYYGSAVARAATVVTSLFVPLVITKWYYSTGRCSFKDNSGCRDAYVSAAIFTGISNLAMLLAAPLVGWAVDLTGPGVVLIATSLLGALSLLGLTLIENPTSVFAIILGIFMGIATIGAVTVSMSLCSDKRRHNSGSVAGVYSFCGGMGVLIVTQFGGYAADLWVKTPYVVLIVLYLILAWQCRKV